ncbi:hypothetical protein DSM110093_00210 [Sulfitobacter sp. DSM 110093]|uniref:hypothetical protein n=1 Tax=Sulfitobacter sp. DSM 110093 TaxID=2883127 RepID=UPI001FACA372|nr:hypothetical protein [Sulfitobacter sp. DSM 110093]UOA30462.1 hypothetical protein DSM110093_00210 [Sulfitobacter sp. DSM 110093]
MTIQFESTREAIQSAAKIVPIMACVSMGKYATAQGELVWQKGDIACVRASSAMFVGKRI